MPNIDVLKGLSVLNQTALIRTAATPEKSPTSNWHASGSTNTYMLEALTSLVNECILLVCYLRCVVSPSQVGASNNSFRMGITTSKQVRTPRAYRLRLNTSSRIIRGDSPAGSDEAPSEAPFSIMACHRQALVMVPPVPVPDSRRPPAPVSAGRRC